MIRLFSLLVLFATSTAFALPVGTALDRAPLWAVLSTTIDYNFEGIIALSNCSGSLIRLKSSADTDRALILTNGHCIGQMPEPGEVVVNLPSTRTMSILNPANGRAIGSLKAEKILYSTMTGTDMTIYVMQETYGDILKRFNIRARMLSDHYPLIGEGMDIISGYWKRGYTCRVEAIVPTLKEAGWTMHDSIRYSRPGCETIGGTSGSPIISTVTGEVIGVNNTGNEDGERCTMNNPCEVAADGTVFFQKGISYGQQTSQLYTCLAGPNTLDLNLPGCKLAKPAPTLRRRVRF